MTDSSLQSRWQQLAQTYTEDQALVASLWRHIERGYREPQRHYHTLSHLTAVFNDIDAAAIANGMSAGDALAFAVFYHDIVYRPGSTRNEKASARQAQRSMTRLCVPRPEIDQVSYMIRCTQQHNNPTNDKNTQLFLDADMAILGVDSASYARYCLAVRREFGKTPDRLFRRGRKRFVARTLAQQKIYQSDHFFAAYEQQARINLSDELRLL